MSVEKKKVISIAVQLCIPIQNANSNEALTQGQACVV